MHDTKISALEMYCFTYLVILVVKRRMSTISDGRCMRWQPCCGDMQRTVKRNGRQAPGHIDAPPHAAATVGHNSQSLLENCRHHLQVRMGADRTSSQQRSRSRPRKVGRSWLVSHECISRVCITVMACLRQYTSLRCRQHDYGELQMSGLYIRSFKDPNIRMYLPELRTANVWIICPLIQHPNIPMYIPGL